MDIERLQNSRMKHAEQQRHLGRDEGRVWARVSAEWAQLEKLTDFLGEFYDADIPPHLFAQDLIAREDGPTLPWTQNEEWPSDEFVYGFLEGVREVWREVQAQGDVRFDAS